MKKFIRSLMMLAILFSGFLGMGGQADAAETDTMAFTLHKLVFPENGMPEASQNEGDERLKDYDGLNGVTFDVYDVTADFYRLLAESEEKDAKKVQSELQNMDVSDRTFLAQQVTATIGGKDGVAEFHLPKLSGGEDAVYLFRESAAPSDVKSKAVDMVVALPIIDPVGELLEGPIHLYPKNEIVHPPFEKKILGQQPSYQLGEPIMYELTTKLPSSLSMYTKFLISDQADESLLLDAQSIVVKTADENYDGYQLATSDHGFTLNFDLAKLKAHIGKKITISYTMTLKDPSKVDQDIINQAELETDFDTIVRERKVKTGGKKFIKVDAIEKDHVLSDAVFIVKNAKGEYLLEGEKEYQWTKKKEEASLLKRTSNEDGFFEIKGLRYGNYSLEEIKAPDGYLVSKKEIPFEVSESSYTFSKGILQVVNQKETPPSKQTEKPSPTETKKLATGPLAQYPKMNDTRNLLFILIGGSLVVGVIVLAFKRKTRRSE
ncbi:hypothetical protein IGI39_002735 [Enterococcus sp. AZ135]|uniref:SpaH/EbpB family LPXTG-anchored major pilin n=1 Tax=unclassified Enterococcus TaxID=2608891 RepID=UPI003F21C659